MDRLAEITQCLREDILSGFFAPGERLVEAQLTDRYRVGRTAVRLALVELATEGLVERSLNRGATVRLVSFHEAVEITEARIALERLLAAKAAERATAADRIELAEIEGAMRQAVADDTPAAYARLNERFHRRIREMSGHDVAAELVANLRNRAAHHQYRLAQMPGRPSESVEQHAAIAAAITAGDSEAAAAAMERHLTSVVEALERWVDRIAAI